ncbi:MAG: hypothetical protein NXI24_08375 [bacterium]|nr:hypothetical protein [bacterium]
MIDGGDEQNPKAPAGEAFSGAVPGGAWKAAANFQPPTEPEDLREFYITPTYLAVMKDRARDWSDEFIREQYRIFRGTVVAEYPEVLDLLESELHRRNLNRLRKGIRRKSREDVLALREKYAAEADYVEVIDTELEIRGGARRLHDRSDGRTEVLDA